MKFLNSKLSAVLISAAVACIPAFAQLTSGNLTGTVFDPAGAAVPSAEIVAHNDATGIDATTHSTSAGDYRFENLPVGTYTLTVTVAGFSKFEAKGLAIQLNATITQNVNLAVTQSTTTVEVTEVATPIDTTSAQIQTTFSTKEATDLPSTATGSGVLNLALLAPGVATSGTVGAGTGPSVGGQRPRNNNFTIEGIDNNDGAVTGPLVMVPNDSVAEFAALQNQFTADFGHSSGGQFNTVIASGTNTYHGMLYEYFQNRDLNAADNLSAVGGTPLHPRFDNNRFGGNFGGPIIHNKLFFFADYEYNPVGQAGNAGILYAPTQAGLAQIAATPGINANNFAQFKKYVPVAPSVCPPTDGNCPTVYLGSASSGVLAGGTTGTTIPVGQIAVAVPSYNNNEAGVGSLDYTLSDKDSLRARFILNRSGTIDTAATFPAFFQTVPTNNYLATISEYHSFSATVQNELRLGYGKHEQDIASGNFSFPGLDQFPNLQFADLGVQVGPDPNAPQYTYQNLYQLTDNVSWTRGKHSFKFGFDGMRNISPQSFTQRARGDYEYSSFSDYLFDYVPDQLAERSAGDPIYWGNRYLWSGFANDVWKVTPNLTLNLGLRYEYETVPAGENQQSLNSIANDPGLIVFHSPKPQTTNFMPRVGIAYSPGTSGKTSIRAGFGINYDVLYDNLGTLSLPPELSTTQDVTGAGTSGFLASGGLPPTGPSAHFTQAEARANTAGFVPDVKRPKSYQWNLGIQHEFAQNYVFESRYLGTRGTDLDVQDHINEEPRVTAANALPLFWGAVPSQSALDTMRTLGAITSQSYFVPAYQAAGFTSQITAFMPYGNSIYHGWANSLTRRFHNGLQFVGAYTWSHAIDDSTADVYSTVSSPRRPQNPQAISLDRASSALDHRQRLTTEVMYDVPFFKHSNWLLKNVLGNWEVAPIYTYQSGTPYTVQSGVDANLDHDSWPDRAFVNPNGGNPNVGSPVNPQFNSQGIACNATNAANAGNPSYQTLDCTKYIVGYQVVNPAAGYVNAAAGTLPNAGRNTKMLNPIDDIDITATKRISITERWKVEFSARAFNVLNHPQYIGGSLNDVAPVGATSNDQRSFMEPRQPLFGQITQVWSSNPRALVLDLKLIF